jgi:hypothetical protein
LESQLPGAGQSTVNLQKIKQLRIAVSSSLIQAVRTWLSIHQMSGDEYSLSLRIRSFVGSLLHQIATPLAKYLKEPFLSQAELGKLVNEIPSTLSLHANMWVQNGSLSKLQIFIPDTSASLLIGITHPASPVEVPGGATMLTVKNLTDLFATAMSSGLSANPATAVLGSL